MYNPNLLPIQKIHFTHSQQYDENHCVYLARIGRHSEKKNSGNVGKTTESVHCTITGSNLGIQHVHFST